MEPTPTSAPVTTTSVSIRYGLLAGVASIILSLLLFLTNMDQSPVRWLGLVIIVGAIVLAHNQFKQGNGGFMSYGQGLGIGTLLSAVSGIISTIFSYIYMTYIDTGYMARVMEKTRMDMEAKGNMSDAQIDQAMGMAEKFSGGVWILVFGILGGIFIGFVISLIISAFTKHNRPEFE